jgi:AcrR family transcriptional regulator
MVLIMENKEIQEQRIKGYFIEATKEILKGEGLKVVSVRNIAERAGYSYATLYNYFKDVKDLIFLCVKDFQDECESFVSSETKKTERGKEKIRAIALSYMKYFVQYPGIFELFFLEKVTDVASKQPTIELIYSFLDRLTEKEWEYCISKKMVTAEQAELTKTEINALLTGLLLFYLNRRVPSTYFVFLQTVNTQLDYILSKAIVL